jgi:outer membrane immunogenic protein
MDFPTGVTMMPLLRAIRGMGNFLSRTGLESALIFRSNYSASEGWGNPMKKILLAGIAAAALALPASVLAADRPVPYKAAPVAPVAAVFNWTGFYAGGQVGGGWDSVDWNLATGLLASVRSRASGVVGGGQLGYNWQSGPWVLGVEAAGLWADLKDSQGALPGFALPPYVTRIDRIGTVVGRLGYAVNRSLLYVDGGWATARLSLSGPNNLIGDVFATRGFEDGWTVGVGWDYALENNWILGIDYKHIELGNATRSGLSNLALPFVLTDINPKINLVTLRLSYKFGDWGKSPVVAKY